MDWVSRIILGLLLLLGGLAYTGYRVLADIDGDPNEGPFGGWGPVLAGLFIAALGVLILIF